VGVVVGGVGCLGGGGGFGVGVGWGVGLFWWKAAGCLGDMYHRTTRPENDEDAYNRGGAFPGSGQQKILK